MRTRLKQAVLILFTLAGLTVPVGVGAAMTTDAATKSVELRDLVGTNGNLATTAGLTANVMFDGWRMTSNIAAGEAPAFSPLDPTAGDALEAASWFTLGSNGSGGAALNQPVSALVVYNGDLIVGGVFTNGGGKAAADFIARWNGSSWSALGSNGSGNGALNARVNALVVFEGKLIAGGEFTDAANNPAADYVARWDGSNWSNIGSYAGNGVFNNKVRALAATDEDLYAGGNFSWVGGNKGANYAARWSGSVWGAIDGATDAPAALNGPVWSVATAGVSVYLGGEFQNGAGMATADRFIKWNGSAWQALGSNGAGDGAFNNVVYAIAVNSGTVFAGGVFQNAAGKPKADRIARWDGSAWYALGSNGAGDGALNATVSALKFYNGILFVGGDFFNVGGDIHADKVAKWNGTSWSALGYAGLGGDGLGGHVSALAFRNGYMYAGGGFLNGSGYGDPKMDYIAGYGPLTTPTYKPDGRIRLGIDGTLVGNNIFNGDGTNQSRTAYTTVGSTATFYMQVQNDGNKDDSYLIRAYGVNIAGYTIRFYRGDTEITSAVNAGTYHTAAVAPGAVFKIRAVVSVDGAATMGSANSRLVRFYSYTDDTKLDTVQFIVFRA